VETENDQEINLATGKDKNVLPGGGSQTEVDEMDLP